jgi:hypothetical protein
VVHSHEPPARLLKDTVCAWWPKSIGR